MENRRTCQDTAIHTAVIRTDGAACTSVALTFLEYVTELHSVALGTKRFLFYLMVSRLAFRREIERTFLANYVNQ